MPVVLVPRIDYARCAACRICQAARHCRFKAVARIDRDEPPYVQVTLCGGCGECAPYCPNQAIIPAVPPHSK